MCALVTGVQTCALPISFGEYKAVYHLDNQGAPRDATANGANATGGEGRNAGGLIGQSLRLDGTSPVSLPASVFGSGPFSAIFWVKPGSADGQLLNVPGSSSLAFAGGRSFVEAVGGRWGGAALSRGICRAE